MPDSSQILVPRWHHVVDWRQLWWLLPVVVVLSGVFTIQALQARNALDDAATQADVLRDQLVGGDTAGAASTLARLQDSAEDARSATDGPLWWTLAQVPWLGRNVEAVSVVSAEIERVADVAAPPVVDVADQINARTFSPTDGAIDVAAIGRLAAAVSTSHDALRDTAGRLAAIDTDSLVGPLRGPVGELTTKVDSVESVAQNADLAAELLPDLLGARGPRHYLLMNQNNAEIRSTGGIVGSFAVITADQGRVTLGTQGSIQDLPPLDEPLLPLTADELESFPSSIGTDIRDVNITPDFPRTAALAQSLVENRFDVDLDGVLSVDPVAVSHLLAGTGPIELDSGQILDEDNAVDLLLHDVYTDIDDIEAQDEFFEQANDRIFAAFVQGDGDPSAVLSALVQGIEENRITFWSDRASEQDLIAPTALSGAFAADDGPTPHVGVYLSDAASTKMEYFLDQDTTVLATRCLDGGRQELTTTTTLTSTAPADAASLAESVTGFGTFVPRGQMRLIMRLFAPYEGTVTSLALDGAQVPISDSAFRGRGLARVDFVLRPGQSHTVTTRIVTGAGQTGDPILTTTPGIASTDNDRSVPSACRT